jgi:hypothetical protein
VNRLEDLIRETLRDHEAEAPDGASLLASVHERVSNRHRANRTVTAFAAAFVVVALVAGIAAFAVSRHRDAQSPSSIVPQPTAPAPTAPAPTPATTAIPPACVHVAGTEVGNSYYGVPDPNGTRIDYLDAHRSETADDGEGNEIRASDGGIQIVRPDGLVALPRTYLRAHADFDGDGRTDLLVERVDGPGLGWYIVPGTVAVGTHDVEAVGIRLAVPTPGPAGYLDDWMPVGDQDRDGAADLVAVGRLYSGRQLTSGGPGSALDELPAPLRTYALPITGVLQLDPTGPPSIVETDEQATGGPAIVFDDRTDRLIDDPAVGITMTGTIFNGATATGWLVDSHRIVQLHYSNRSGAFVWRWDLDGPCA